jgi:RES domain-containing protein
MSADGRVVIFNTEADNLVPGDTYNTEDLIEHDRQTGITSLFAAGNGEASLSATGRYVVFDSYSGNLVPGDTNNRNDVFVKDRQTGQITRVSVSSDGGQAIFGAGGGSISEDGRFVAFSSISNNLVPDDTNGVGDVFVHDRQTGQTTIVSISSDGEQANYGSSDSLISADGHFILFCTRANNLVPGGTDGGAHVFVHERLSGQTTIVDVSSDGTHANAWSGVGSISADGRFITFGSAADNLVPDDTNGVSDVFVHDLHTGQTTRVSLNSDGDQANGGCDSGAISDDGRFVAFGSNADNLVPNDTNGEDDIFFHDRQTRQTTIVNLNSDGEQANGWSYGTWISADGRFIIFGSEADNLVPGDTNVVSDIFMYDRLFTEIIDNTDPQFSTEGNWNVSDKAAGYYGTDYSYAKAGDVSGIATFTFEIPADGNYEISAQWPAHSTRAPDAPFTIINNGSLIDTVLMDQRINGGRFNPLTGPEALSTGIYALNAGVLEVTLSNDADGKVAGDAVKVIEMLEQRIPVAEIIDNTDPQFSTEGNWNVSDKAAGYYGTDYSYAKAGDVSGIATFTFEIPADGNYEISAQWPAHSTRAPDAPFTIINNGILIDTVLMDQRINGGRFNPLHGHAAINSNTYTLDAGDLEVTLSNNASGKVAADAVQVISK